MALSSLAAPCFARSAPGLRASRRRRTPRPSRLHEVFPAPVPRATDDDDDARSCAADPDAPPPTASRPDAELADARVRAERVAVRLKLRGAGGGGSSSPPGASSSSSSSVPSVPSRRRSLDAAIASQGPSIESESSSRPGEAEDDGDDERLLPPPSASSVQLSPTIAAERLAARARLERYAIGRYAIRRGRVVDRVTGGLAPANDADHPLFTPIADRVALAARRVEQATQELERASEAVEAKRVELETRREDLARLERLEAEEEEEEEKTRSEANAASDSRRSSTSAASRDGDGDGDGDGDPSRSVPSAAERRAVRAAFSPPPPREGAAPRLSSAGTGTRDPSKSATRRALDGPPAPAESDDESAARLSRASDAIRARASSSLSLSLSRLRRKRRPGGRPVPGRSSGAPRRRCDVSFASVAATPRSLEPSSAENATTPSPSLEPSIPRGTACLLPKPIFVLSDCTGESAARTVRAALNQFAEITNLSAPANLFVFRFLSDPEDAYKLVEQASRDDALVVHTLSDAEMAVAVNTARKLYGVEAVDLWGPLLRAMEAHLDMRAAMEPLLFGGKGVGGDGGEGGSSLEERRRRTHSSSELLSTEYYEMIEAVEFTRRADDGARPDEWKNADALILGVSRTGKTPLSIYLGQRGFRVANLPLVPRDGALMVPRQVHEVAPDRVFGLLIDAEVLHAIRANRLRSMGVDGGSFSSGDANAANANGVASYASTRSAREELRLARELFDANPGWTVMDVTHKGVEETAARIMKAMHDARGGRRGARGSPPGVIER
jgi:regulator of PEP synthase PpsR (kinase-PPPase family)